MEIVPYNNNQGEVGIIGGGRNNRGVLGEIENSLCLRQARILYIYVNSDVTDTFTLISGSVECFSLDFSCVCSEIMSSIISFFQKIIKGGLE